MRIVLDNKEFECTKFVVFDKFGNAVAAGYDHADILVFDTCAGPDFPKILSIVGYPDRLPTQIIDTKPLIPNLSPIKPDTGTDHAGNDHWTTLNF